MTISQSLSNKIANMSFVCACLVVAIHTPSPGGVLSGWCKCWIGNGLSCIAVPTFFVISGFFLGKCVEDEGWYANAVKKRVKSLVVPFFVVNLLWWPIKYGIHYVGVTHFGMNGTNPNEDITLYNFLYYTGLLPWGGNCVVGLWYVRALFYLVVVSPALVWFVKKSKLLAWLFMGVLLIGWCVQMELVPRTTQFVQGKMSFEYSLRCPLFFSIGLYVARWGGGAKTVKIRFVLARANGCRCFDFA